MQCPNADLNEKVNHNVVFLLAGTKEKNHTENMQKIQAVRAHGSIRILLNLHANLTVFLIRKAQFLAL